MAGPYVSLPKLFQEIFFFHFDSKVRFLRNIIKKTSEGVNISVFTAGPHSRNLVVFNIIINLYNSHVILHSRIDTLCP